MLGAMAYLGEHDDVPHALIPLDLAVGLIRAKVYGESAMDLDAVASVVAAIVPLYEYDTDSTQLPRALKPAEVAGGLFREGGKELRFIDGRSTKRNLAAHALDVECVTALLKQPENAARIHTRFLRLRAQKIKARSRAVRAASERLRVEAMALRATNDRAVFAIALETRSPA